jgi:hypothetical protein
MSELKIPDDMKAMYATAQSQRCNWPPEYIVRLIERIARLEQERDSLQTQLATPTKFDELMKDEDFRRIYAAECAKGDIEQLRAQLARANGLIAQAHNDFAAFLDSQVKP